MHSEGTRGFTLTELLVITIVGSVLAAIAIPRYFRLVERNRVTEAISMLSSIRSAQERVLSIQGNYVRTNMGTGNFDLHGKDPTYGMRNYFLVLGPGNPAGCRPKTPFYSVRFIRITDNAGVSSRYFKNYSLLYERCADKISWPGCPNCAQDFR